MARQHPALAFLNRLAGAAITGATVGCTTSLAIGLPQGCLVAALVGALAACLLVSAGSLALGGERTEHCLKTARARAQDYLGNHISPAAGRVVRMALAYSRHGQEVRLATALGAVAGELTMLAVFAAASAI